VLFSFFRITVEENMVPNQAPLQIGMLLFPGLTLLDLIGPQTVFSWHAQTHLVWKTTDTVVSDTGIGIQPTATFADCPNELDILFVPGGFGTADAMRDREVLDFLVGKAARAKYVTSVCSGSLILAAAGLLTGYQATSHWALRDLLGLFGAEPVEGRVVVDRNRITGGGVTAGIDFGLVLLAKMRGDQAAKVTQLAMEYDPAPPFSAGSPKGAGPDIVKQAMSAMGTMDSEARQIAEQSRKRLASQAEIQ
jgi:cyclohexyl-isocyanide hydratase